jgi:hypothetical protein
MRIKKRNSKEAPSKQNKVKKKTSKKSRAQVNFTNLPS